MRQTMNGKISVINFMFDSRSALSTQEEQSVTEIIKGRDKCVIRLT